MAAARAAVKLGSLVKDEAIFWTKSCGKISIELEVDASLPVSRTGCLVARLGNPGGWTRPRIPLSGADDFIVAVVGLLGISEVGLGQELFGNSVFVWVGQW